MLALILAILWCVLLTAISWALTCGVLYLITLCFSIVFSWKIATGIWLILFILTQFFGKE